jgi:hypothetical protein
MSRGRFGNQPQAITAVFIVVLTANGDWYRIFVTDQQRLWFLGEGICGL